MKSVLLSIKKFGKEEKMNTYAKYVRLKEATGVTDYRVATDTGIGKSTFTDWKKGRSSPKLDKLMKIANFFGVSVEYFLT